MTRIRLFLSHFPFTVATLVVLIIAALVTNTTFQAITYHWLNRTGLAPLSLPYLMIIFGIVAMYFISAEFAKHWFYKHWE